MVATLVSIAAVDGVGQSVPDRWKPLWWAAVLVAFAGCFAWLVRHARAHTGGRDQHALFRKALRTGRVPEDADGARWQRLIDEQRRSRPGVWWFFGILAVLIAAVNIHSALTSDLSPAAKAALLVVAVALAVGLWVGVPALIIRRQNRQLDALRDQLDDPSST